MKCNFNLLYLISGSTRLAPLCLIRLVTLGDVATVGVGEIFYASKIKPAGRNMRDAILSLSRHEPEYLMPGLITHVFKQASF